MFCRAHEFHLPYVAARAAGLTGRSAGESMSKLNDDRLILIAREAGSLRWIC